MWLPEIHSQSIASCSYYTARKKFLFFVERFSYTVTETKVEMCCLTSENIFDCIEIVLRTLSRDMTRNVIL